MTTKKVLISLTALSTMLALTAQVATAQTTAPTQTTTTSAAEVKPESAKKWGVSLFADMETSNESLNKNLDADLTNSYILKPSYKLDKNTSLFMRAAVVQKMKTRSGSEPNNTLADLVVGGTQSLENVWNLFPKMSLEHRVYLPTSNASKNDGSYGRYYGLYGAPFAITPKLELSYNFWPSAIAYTGAGAKSGAKFSLTHFGEIAYNITETVSVAQDIGLAHGYNSLPNLGGSINSNKLKLTSAISWAPNKNFATILYLNEQKDNMNGTFEHGLYQSDASTYELLLVLSI
ncbi:MAG TPA: hypothetical protein PLJ21_10420 [Pseudobdellovibrionaceae bacterium]|nr:hypothetical protein [Pseudobdellovibrionaceae bacterium]